MNNSRSFAMRVISVIAAFALAASCLLTSCIVGAASNTNTSSNTNITKQTNDVDYTFRSSKLLNEHYKKHGVEMGFTSASDYEKAASDVVNNPKALHKLEKEDNDDVYYVEKTNDFVIVSTDGYIRTYYRPNSGKAYFDRQ